MRSSSTPAAARSVASRAALLVAVAVTASALLLPPSSARAGDEHRTEGLIPYILIGPKVGGALLFPPNLMVGAEVKVLGWVGASFEYGVYPRNLTVNDVAFGIDSWSLGLRWYPFRGAFFVGAVFGSYELNGAQSVGFPPTIGTLNVSSLYLGPQIGWKWDWDFGLFLGLNLGYGFNLNYKSVLIVPGVSAGDLAEAKSNLDKYISVGVPVITLLEIGWFF
jgi:hypothetical protein